MQSLLYFELFPWLYHLLSVYAGMSVWLWHHHGFMQLLYSGLEECGWEFYLFLFLSFFPLKFKNCQANSHPWKNGIRNLLFSATSWNTQMLWQRKKCTVSILCRNLSCLHYQGRHFLEVSIGICFHNLAINWISLKELLFFSYYFNYKIGYVIS